MTVRPEAGFYWDDGEYVAEHDVAVRGIRWARTGLLNAKGQMILKRLELPVGFNADHSQPQYAIEDED